MIIQFVTVYSQIKCLKLLVMDKNDKIIQYHHMANGKTMVSG